MVDLSKMKDKKDAAKLFDYSVLPKNSLKEEILEGCELTRKYGFAAFYCSGAFWIPLMAEELSDMEEVEIGAAIAFPFGSATAAAKAFETEDAVKRGANAVDVCINVGALKGKDYDTIRDELTQFVDAAAGAVTKCILEVDMLTDDELATGCKLIEETGVDYAKTSSGQFGGPTLEQVILMRETLKGGPTKVKVAGVKFPRPQNAFAFVQVGADRIGTRAAPLIVDAFPLLREEGLIPPYKG
jgi:deoxyribose-phosphate aldolase